MQARAYVSARRCSTPTMCALPAWPKIDSYSTPRHSLITSISIALFSIIGRCHAFLINLKPILFCISSSRHRSSMRLSYNGPRRFQIYCRICFLYIRYNQNPYEGTFSMLHCKISIRPLSCQAPDARIFPCCGEASNSCRILWQALSLNRSI